MSEVLTDEAVLTVARFVVPHVTKLFKQIEACLSIVVIVRLTTVPVRVAHGLVSIAGRRFPHKLGLGVC